LWLSAAATFALRTRSAIARLWAFGDPFSIGFFLVALHLSPLRSNQLKQFLL
jgi:hypothetical protein